MNISQQQNKKSLSVDVFLVGASTLPKTAAPRLPVAESSRGVAAELSGGVIINSRTSQYIKVVSCMLISESSLTAGCKKNGEGGTGAYVYDEVRLSRDMHTPKNEQKINKA